MSSNSSPVSRHNVSRYERCAVGHRLVARLPLVRIALKGRLIGIIRLVLHGANREQNNAPALGLKRHDVSDARHLARFIEPMLLLRTDALPNPARWAYELKLDGYRAIAFKRDGALHLRSRNDKDFPPLPRCRQGLAKLPTTP